MSDYAYEDILQPCLYDNSYASDFINYLISEDIKQKSDDMLPDFMYHIIPLDDLQKQIEDLEYASRNKFSKQGLFNPYYRSITDKKTTVDFHASTIPTEPEEIRSLHIEGKCTAFITRAQSIFFVSVVPCSHLIWYSKTKLPELGIYIIGNTIKGNALTSLTGIYEYKFERIDCTIMRTKDAAYSFNDFFHISSSQEMEEIIGKIPELLSISTITNEQALVNFAVVLKSLN